MRTLALFLALSLAVAASAEWVRWSFPQRRRLGGDVIDSTCGVREGQCRQRCEENSSCRGYLFCDAPQWMGDCADGLGKDCCQLKNWVGEPQYWGEGAGYVSQVAENRNGNSGGGGGGNVQWSQPMPRNLQGSNVNTVCGVSQDQCRAECLKISQCTGVNWCSPSNGLTQCGDRQRGCCDLKSFSGSPNYWGDSTSVPGDGWISQVIENRGGGAPGQPR